jgi:hypothetical protein
MPPHSTVRRYFASRNQAFPERITGNPELTRFVKGATEFARKQNECSDLVTSPVYPLAENKALSHREQKP